MKRLNLPQGFTSAQIRDNGAKGHPQGVITIPNWVIRFCKIKHKTVMEWDPKRKDDGSYEILIRPIPLEEASRKSRLGI